MAHRSRNAAPDQALADAVAQALARSSVDFFGRLVEALGERGLATTRTALATLLNVRPATIAAWAQGRATPAMDAMVRLARAGGVDLQSWLALGGAAAKDPEADDLLKCFSRLGPEARAFVLQAARTAARAEDARVSARRSPTAAAGAARRAKARRPR